MLKTICLYGFPPISVPILICLFVKRGDNRNLSSAYKLEGKEIMLLLFFKFRYATLQTWTAFFYIFVMVSNKYTQVIRIIVYVIRKSLTVCHRYSLVPKVFAHVKKSLYNQPKPYFFKKLLWSHFWIDVNNFYTKTFGIVYILIVYLLIMFIWVVFICT